MPDRPFSVHVDPDELERRHLSAAVSLPPADVPEHPPTTPHPTAAPGRVTARPNGRVRGSARTYAFRRS